MSKHQLICLSVIELDTNGEVMETYRYPAIAPNVNQVILSRSPLFHRSLLSDEREQQQILTSAAAAKNNNHHHYHYMFSKYQDMNLYTITVLLDKRKQMNNGDDNNGNNKKTTTGNEKSTGSGKSVQVTAYSITLCTKDYHPTLYQSCLMQVFAPVYLRSEGASQSFDAVQLLGAYLSVFASGKFKNLFSSAAPQFDKRLTKVGNVALLAKLFCLGSNNSNDQSSMMKSDDHDGGESQTNGASQAGVTSEEHFCRIWTAMLLRRRVLVHNDKILELNTIVDAFPSLCWHRATTGGNSGSSAAKNKGQSQSLLFNNMIRPFVNLNCGAEVSDLENMGVFVAGVNNTDTLKKSVKYDLFVDVSRRETIVSDHAANDFRLTKIHRDMFAAVRAQLEQAPEQVSAVTANKESSELNETLIRVIAEHTQGVIDKLRTIKESNGGVLDMAVIQSVSKQPDTQRFLYNIALSEGLLDQYSQASSTPQEE